MSDNIRELFQRGKTPENGDFYSVFETSDSRLDLRWEDGFRCSVPYMHMHEIRYTPRNAEELEEIVLHAPAFSVVRIVGRHLSEIYDALNAHRISWIRERANGEDIPQDGVSVDLIEFTALTDWRLDVEALNERRAVLLKE